MAVRQKVLLFSLCLLFLFSNCRRKHGRDKLHYETEFILNKNEVGKFFSRHRDLKDYRQLVDSFYTGHEYRFVWMDGRGLHSQAQNFMNMLNQDTIAFQASYSVQQLQQKFAELVTEDYKFKQDDSLSNEVELLLTAGFFDYAKRNWSGKGKEFSNRVQWFIERKRLDYDALLDSVLKEKTIVEPVYRQYALLKKFLPVI